MTRPDTEVRPRLVVIGNGMAAGRALETLLEKTPGRYAVTVFGAEPRVNYDRIMLSPVLAGEKTYNEIIIHDEAWYVRHDVRLQRGKRVVEIDRAGQRIIAADGTIEPYDHLLIATGSDPFIVPVPGKRSKSVV